MDIDESKVRDSPESSVFMQICFPLKFCMAWMYPLILQACWHPPTAEDTPRLPIRNRVETSIEVFDRVWAKKRTCPCGLLLSLIRVLWQPFLLNFLSQGVSTVAAVASPLVFEKFLESISPPMTESIRNQIEFARLILPPDLRPADPATSLFVGFRPDNSSCWLWLLSVVALRFVDVIALHFAFYTAYQAGMRARAVLVSQVYKKSLRLSSLARSQFPNGVILNRSQSDSMKVERAFLMIVYAIWAVPFFAVTAYFIVRLLGWPGVAGLGVTVINVPVMTLVYVSLTHIRTKMAVYADERTKKTTEMLQGIRILKFFGWEKPYLDRIFRVRKSEACGWRWVGMLYGFLFTLMSSTCVLSQVVTVVTMWFLGKGTPLNPVTVFTSLSYFNLLMFPLTLIPITLVSVVECLVSVRRLTELLNADELEPCGQLRSGIGDVELVGASFRWESDPKKEKKSKDEDDDSEKKEMDQEEEGEGAPEEVIEMADVSLLRDDGGEDVVHVGEEEGEGEGGEKDVGIPVKTHLRELSAVFAKGSLTMVIGKVGSGKSSLLSALLGEMKHVSGTVVPPTNVAYCDQSPWIQNCTLKENILFGLPYDEELFSTVLQICSLNPDLESGAIGVEMEIGEKGINLSGGQKYRVSLARSCYRANVAAVYLLDDPLGAVDAHVGHDILEECICGFLGGKTRIVTLHQLQYLSRADQVVLLEDGEIAEIGTYQDLMAIENGKTRQLVEMYVREREKKENEEEGEDEDGPDNRKRRKTSSSESGKKAQEGRKDKVIVKEDKEQGCVKCGVYVTYFRAMGFGGIGPVLFLGILLLLAEGLLSGNSFLLSAWTGGSLTEKRGTGIMTQYYATVVNDSSSSYANATYYSPYANASCPVSYPHVCVTEFCVDVVWDPFYANETVLEPGMNHLEALGAYAILGFLGCVFVYLVHSFIMICGTNASNTLHNRAVRRVANSPMSYFDATPIGRIVARFTVDVMLADFMLPLCLTVFLTLITRVIARNILTCIFTSGVFVPILAVCAVVYGVMYVFHRAATVEWKRLESVTRSPIMALLSETLNGLSTIRSYCRESYFEKMNNTRIDVNNRSYFLMWTAKRWLGANIGVLNSFFIVFVGAICISLSFYSPESWNMNVASLALALTSFLSATLELARTVDYATDTESMLNCIERLGHFAKNLKTEEELQSEELKERGKELVAAVPHNWPNKPTIRFSKFSMRYRPHLPVVLDGISFEIKPGEKVGVCGRTGSGKSSLLLAIYRFVQGFRGEITIDELDVSCVPIPDLRSALAIIPQEPRLFGGTVRSNLDPFGVYEDAAIWDALERSFMKEKISSMDGKLDSETQDGGSNFSLGERQLLCLARALLKESKILLLDEVTTSVDMKTDDLIQQTLKDCFGHCTCLTIAHRLNTIINSDRILVISDGKVAEFDTPRKLLSLPKYHLFADLVDETGEANARFLRERIEVGNDM